MAARIHLVRHGVCAHEHDGSWVGATGQQRFIEQYDAAGIRGDPPPEVVEVAATADVLAASTLRRAIEWVATGSDPWRLPPLPLRGAARPRLASGVRAEDVSQLERVVFSRAMKRMQILQVPISRFRMNRRAASLLLLLAAVTESAQQPTTPQRGRGGGRGPAGPPWRTAADTARAHRLYVSTDTADMPRIDSARAARDIEARLKTEEFFRAKSKGVMDFQIVSYKSVDGMEIPAYVFSPLQKRGAKGHAAIVMVHGYVHGRFEDRQLVWVREAVQQGYVIVTPQYRGSTGYGADFWRAIDYGGKEIDDVRSSYDYIKASLPYVDPDRVGIMGWSHGGFITAHNLFRDPQPFKAGAPIVPVTNLIFRLGTHSPSYAQPFASRPEVKGMPFENVEEYVRRSPVFHAANLKVPILVHVATNDCDVHFIENQQMVYTLQALHPELTDAKIYKDPPYLQALGGCGHTFSERVVLDPNSPRYMERDDTPEQIDAWNRIWAFFRKNLNPDKGK